MIDLFVFCDLGRTEVTVRGTLDESDVTSLVRVVDGLSVDSPITVDLTQVDGGTDAGVRQLARAVARWTARDVHVAVPRGGWIGAEPEVAFA